MEHEDVSSVITAKELVQTLLALNVLRHIHDEPEFFAKVSRPVALAYLWLTRFSPRLARVCTCSWIVRIGAMPIASLHLV